MRNREGTIVPYNDDVTSMLKALRGSASIPSASLLAPQVHKKKGWLKIR